MNLKSFPRSHYVFITDNIWTE